MSDHRDPAPEDTPVLGNWYTAEGNLWEATVRYEIAQQAAILQLALTSDELDGLAAGVAVELYHRWSITPIHPVPTGFEPRDGIDRE